MNAKRMRILRRDVEECGWRRKLSKPCQGDLCLENFLSLMASSPWPRKVQTSILDNNLLGKEYMKLQKLNTSYKT